MSGSHHVFRCEITQTAINIVVPVHGNNVKAPYVKEVIEILDEFFPELPQDDEADDE